MCCIYRSIWRETASSLLSSPHTRVLLITSLNEPLRGAFCRSLSFPLQLSPLDTAPGSSCLGLFAGSQLHLTPPGPLPALQPGLSLKAVSWAMAGLTSGISHLSGFPVLHCERVNVSMLFFQIFRPL